MNALLNTNSSLGLQIMFHFILPVVSGFALGFMVNRFVRGGFAAKLLVSRMDADRDSHKPPHPTQTEEVEEVGDDDQTKPFVRGEEKL